MPALAVQLYLGVIRCRWRRGRGRIRSSWDGRGEKERLERNASGSWDGRRGRGDSLVLHVEEEIMLLAHSFGELA